MSHPALVNATNALNAAAGTINEIQAVRAQWEQLRDAEPPVDALPVDPPELPLEALITYAHAQATVALADAVVTLVERVIAGGAPGAPAGLVVPSPVIR